jgi:hypothetical protein
MPVDWWDDLGCLARDVDWVTAFARQGQARVRTEARELTAHSHSTYSNTATHAQAARLSACKGPVSRVRPAGRPKQRWWRLARRRPPRAGAAPCLSATTWLLLSVSVDCAPHCGGAPTDPTRRVKRTHHQRSGARASILPFFVRRWIGWVGWYAGLGPARRL